MTSNESSLSEKVQASFRELTTAAKNLNQVSDELSQTISFLDAVLQKLNLGVSAWVPVTGDEDPNGHYWSRDIGYAKVENHWGSRSEIFTEVTTTLTGKSRRMTYGCSTTLRDGCAPKASRTYLRSLKS